MSASILIKGARLLDPANSIDQVLDVRIVDGDVTEIGSDLKLNGSGQLLDATDMWLSPAFIDLHTHLRDFAQSDRETLETGTLAAAAGGYATVLAMANTEPPIDNAAILSQLMSKIEEHALIEVLPVACVTKGMAGAELTSMVELSAIGAAAFSDDGMPISNMAVLRRALEYAKLADRLIISHPEDKDLSQGGCIHECHVSTRLGLPGIPAAAESAAIAREIEVVRQTGGRLHFAHVSCARSVDLIRRARADGLSITADATPHHLSLTVDQSRPYDASYKMNPPLRTEADRKALVAALKDGTLDAIATDHAPHTSLDKSRPFDEAPFGVTGLETAFSLALEHVAASGNLSPSDLIALFTSKPASVLALPQPGIRTGTQASLVVLDPKHVWSYDSEKGYSKSVNSPFHGRSLTGKAVLTVCRGEVVYKHGEVLSSRLSKAR